MGKEQIKKITNIGGQALIEGIMMRGPKQTAISVRVPDGEICTKIQETKSLKDQYPILGWPIIRGCAAMIDSLRTGYKALEFSAEKSGMAQEESEHPSKFDMWIERHFGDKAMNVLMVISAVLGVGLAIALFFFLPTWLFNLLEGVVGEKISVWRSILEGVLRICLFLGYVFICSLLPDIKRVFQYHGAEHKTIFCYECEEPLTIENVRKHSRFHPRCGTSFMIIMLMLGIIVGFFIPFTNPFLRTAVKLLCIPIIVGIGYELIKLCGRCDNVITRMISAPGKWMQRLTTKEPDDTMIEVAIAAMQTVIPENGEDIV